ncbi:hypothetical protein KAR91_79265 [Candidatus Pacearchaeota archaeon]|nr:hypothetical protein [Candidatus Pacearchaeota archaeon]
MVKVLTEANFVLYAAQHYDSVQCLDESEFYDDLKRITYIKRLCTKYADGGNLHIQLLLNHVIIMNNIFGPEATSYLLYLKAKEHMPTLKPILIFIGILPHTFENVGEDTLIHTDEIKMDNEVVKQLREI